MCDLLSWPKNKLLWTLDSHSISNYNWICWHFVGKIKIAWFCLKELIGMKMYEKMYFIGIWELAAMVKHPPVNTQYVRDTALIPGLGRCPGGGNGTLLQDSCQENPMDWRAIPWGCRKVGHDWASEHILGYGIESYFRLDYLSCWIHHF